MVFKIHETFFDVWHRIPFVLFHTCLIPYLSYSMPVLFHTCIILFAFPI